MTKSGQCVRLVRTMRWNGRVKRHDRRGNSGSQRCCTTSMTSRPGRRILPLSMMRPQALTERRGSTTEKIWRTTFGTDPDGWRGPQTPGKTSAACLYRKSGRAKKTARCSGAGRQDRPALRSRGIERDRRVDFLGLLDVFRPGPSQHQALDALAHGISKK